MHESVRALTSLLICVGEGVVIGDRGWQLPGVARGTRGQGEEEDDEEAPVQREYENGL